MIMTLMGKAWTRVEGDQASWLHNDQSDINQKQLFKFLELHDMKLRGG